MASRANAGCNHNHSANYYNMSGMFPKAPSAKATARICRMVAKEVGLDKVFGSLASRLVLPLGLMCLALLPFIMRAIGIIITVGAGAGVAGYAWMRSGHDLPLGVRIVRGDGTEVAAWVRGGDKRVQHR